MSPVSHNRKKDMETLLDAEQIRLTSQVRFRAVGEEGVLVHLENGRVIVVNEVGLFLVQQLASPVTRPELARAVTREFAVSADRVQADLQLYLEELDREQVIEYST
ncbi:Coenzyme PQQ synthesis protein D (PqqD) [Candidatus Electrothrix marina]|uniref:Coenzyme PQQ synthesis protein D (PqqD) n=1 Tax=Candidatus Electrothrix marina TaxID=1859130 RepID=A0A444JH55_9BACT|nr:Coenzyme PQQ synthesis protein D (PqqD) [Candidatus Electrothrix marina]